MKQLILSLLLALTALTAGAQGTDPLGQLKADPKKAFGTDYPYPMVTHPLTKAPKGYKPFYISHYARHGSRYYWSHSLYNELDTLLSTATHRPLSSRRKLLPLNNTSSPRFVMAVPLLHNRSPK